VADFHDAEGQVIDQGVVLRFVAPSSFTGEDVVELQGHGGPVVMDLLLESVLSAGARLAAPGEFSQRAFLNGKIDLAQAEAVADLIDAVSRAAVVGAARSLSGEFSNRIDTFAAQLRELRAFVEAAIDFPEEEVDFLADGQVAARLQGLTRAVQKIRDTARQGVLLNDGLRVVLAGKPNVGKSSLLNQLAGDERAIVTPQAGTTRDLVHAEIAIDGLPLSVTDTAGLRFSDDVVEAEGVRRARQAIDDSDRVLLVVDAAEAARESFDLARTIAEESLPNDRLTLVINKIDLTREAPGDDQKGWGTSSMEGGGIPVLRVSALTRAGMPALRDHLKSVAGYRAEDGVFLARRRHLDALQRCLDALALGERALSERGAGELLAEDLRLAHDALGEIVGRVSSDELLGDIFSQFCIGK
jgi:tRNA modification GTPase